MPPVIPKYESSLAAPCCALAEKWSKASDDEVKQFTKEDFDRLDSKQKQIFFAELLEEEKPLSAAKVCTHSYICKNDSLSYIQL